MEEREFEIWQEGYQCSGNASPAHLIGSARGATFHKACENYFEKHPDPLYNAGANTVWGCRLFDNEQDARSSFG